MSPERENEVRDLLLRGMGIKEICARVYLSVNGVKYWTRKVYKRYGVENRIELMALFIAEYRIELMALFIAEGKRNGRFEHSVNDVHDRSDDRSGHQLA